MPPSKKPSKLSGPEHALRLTGPYPPEAYELVQRGLNHTVRKLFGGQGEPGAKGAAATPKATKPATKRPAVRPRHVTGQQLCDGLREYVLEQWGLLAGAVLARWHITSTLDFGRIVFALVEANWLQATERDSIEDFRDVYDFAAAFGAGAYRVPVEF